MNWRPRPVARPHLGDVAQFGDVADIPPVVGPAMPARRARKARVQLNTRVRVELGQTLQRFVDDHQTTVQDSVELALTEFLAARGYPPPAGGATTDATTEWAHGGHDD